MEAVIDNNAKTVSFTGYRPEKLPDFGDETAFSIATLRQDLHHAVVEAVSRGYNTFLVGMAEGFDMTHSGYFPVDKNNRFV